MTDSIDQQLAKLNKTVYGNGQAGLVTTQAVQDQRLLEITNKLSKVSEDTEVIKTEQTKQSAKLSTMSESLRELSSTKEWFGRQVARWLIPLILGAALMYGATQLPDTPQTHQSITVKDIDNGQ